MPTPTVFYSRCLVCSPQSSCLTHAGKPTGVAVSHGITRFQTQLILNPCQIRYRSHLWDHRSSGRHWSLMPGGCLEYHTVRRVPQLILIWAKTKGINLGNDGSDVLFVFPRKSTCSFHLVSKENLAVFQVFCRGPNSDVHEAPQKKKKKSQARPASPGMLSQVYSSRFPHISRRFPSQGFSFRAVAQGLLQRTGTGFQRVLVPDWPGWGNSDKPQPGQGYDYTSAELVASLTELLEAVAPEPLVVVAQVCPAQGHGSLCGACPECNAHTQGATCRQEVWLRVAGAH